MTPSPSMRPKGREEASQESLELRRATRGGIELNRRELAGAFGDLGTDLPLLVGVTIAADLHPGTVFLLFGALQIATGLVYRLPMPVQPLKAMAAVVIAQQIGGPILAAGGLLVGVTMLALARTGALDWIARTVPRVVVRGIQTGLGLQLALVATTRFMAGDGTRGWLLAAAAMVMVLALRTNRTLPAALVVVTLGLAYALATWPETLATPLSDGFRWGSIVQLPSRWPTPQEFAQGALLLALPQLALSLGNSVLATRQIALDLFPDRPVPTITRIGTTYALMNLLSAPLGGIPVCHGSGGMAGHYAFGGRTGGSVVYYGAIYVLAGLFFGNAPQLFQQLFPAPILGVLLLVEAVTLLTLLRDLTAESRALLFAIACGLVAVMAPYGYAIVLVFGTLLWHGMTSWTAVPSSDSAR